MVFVEHLAGVLAVESVLGLLVPGQLGDEFQVAPGHLVVRGVGRHAAQAFQFSFHLGLDVRGKLRLVQLPAQFGNVLIVAGFAERLLDRPLLLAQEVFALLLVDVVPGLLGDLAAQLADLHLVQQDLVDLLHQLFGGLTLEYRLFLFQGDVGQVGDAVHLRDGVVDGTDELLVDLVAVAAAVEAGDALRQFQVLAQQRIHVRRVRAEVVHRQRLESFVFDLQVFAAIDGLTQADAINALDDHLGALVALLDPVDGGDGAHGEEIVPARVFDGGLLLRHGDDAAAGIDAGVYRGQ